MSNDLEEDHCLVCYNLSKYCRRTEVIHGNSPQGQLKNLKGNWKQYLGCCNWISEKS
jgi:hypothetical protein